MKIRVVLESDTSWFFEIACPNVYVEGKNKFLMQAGGFDYLSSEFVMPISISQIANTQILVFEKLDSALILIKWLIETNLRANDSFARMMD